MRKHIFFAFIGAFVINTSYAVTLTINEGGDTIGSSKKVIIKKGESLSTIAKRYGVSVREVINANPKITPNKRLPAGTQVSVPIQYQLPSGPRTGIVLNLATLRIYYFHPDGVTVSTYPVAAGKQGWSTPQGITTIVGKERNPAWRPPKSIRREAARGGRGLPLVIPPGPHNPLGRYAMRLGMSGILIHGTNKPQSIGTRSSHGCIRMLSKDIEELFNLVPVGTDVHIVHETKNQTLAKQAAAKAEQMNQANQTANQTVEISQTSQTPQTNQLTQTSQTTQTTQTNQMTQTTQTNQTIPSNQVTETKQEQNSLNTEEQAKDQSLSQDPNSIPKQYSTNEAESKS